MATKRVPRSQQTRYRRNKNVTVTEAGLNLILLNPQLRGELLSFQPGETLNNLRNYEQIPLNTIIKTDLISDKEKLKIIINFDIQFSYSKYVKLFTYFKTSIKYDHKERYPDFYGNAPSVLLTLIYYKNLPALRALLHVTPHLNFSESFNYLLSTYTGFFGSKEVKEVKDIIKIVKFILNKSNNKKQKLNDTSLEILGHIDNNELTQLMQLSESQMKRSYMLSDAW